MNSKMDPMGRAIANSAANNDNTLFIIPLLHVKSLYVLHCLSIDNYSAKIVII